MSAADAIDVEFQLPESETSHFYQQESDWAPIFTGADEIELTGKTNVRMIDFLLLQTNETLYPLKVEDHAFSRTIPLQLGENQLKISSNIKDVKPVIQTIYRIRPAEIIQIKSQFKGGKDQIVTLEKPSTLPATYNLSLSSPAVRIEGNFGTAGVTNLKVKDNYNNTLLVEPIGNNKFAIQYTMRGKSAKLVFVTSLENQVLATTHLNFQLDDMIQIDLESDPERQRWLLEKSSIGQTATQLNTVQISGRLESVQDGEVELILNEKSNVISVQDHQFKTELPLQLNRLNRGRLRVRINGQSFFETFQIAQKEPVIQIDRLTQLELDGSIHKPGELLEIHSEGPLEISESILRLSGSAKFSGNLKLVLCHQPGGECLPVAEKGGDFKIQFPAPVGEHTYTLQLQGGSIQRDYDSFSLKVIPAIKLESINYLPYRSGVVKLNKPELLLKGTVAGINRGLMQLSLAGELHSIPVLNHTFEMDKALPIPDGTTEFSLTLNAGLLEFHTSYTLENNSLSTTEIQAVSPEAKDS